MICILKLLLDSDSMRLHVLCAFVMMLATSFAGCIGDSDIEQITDEIIDG